MKKLCVVMMIALATSAFGVDLKDKIASNKGNVSDTAAKELTKKLKNVQNDKGPIIFKTGSAELDAAKCENTLKSIHEIVTQYPGFRVQIEGHTDNVGKPAANLTLSQKRAESVMKYLVAKYKTPAARLTAKGFGDTQPIADNKTADGRAKNRRVDFSVTKI